jgi:hypothetical protein
MIRWEDSEISWYLTTLTMPRQVWSKQGVSAAAHESLCARLDDARGKQTRSLEPKGYVGRRMDEAVSLPHLPFGPVSSIEDAIAQMTSISAALPLTDGLACFNRMYLIVTEKVLSEVSTGTYADPAFLSQLDVVFVNLYFGAIAGWLAEPQAAPCCWSELLANRSDTHIARCSSPSPG